MLALEEAFGVKSWKDLEAFLGPTRFISILEDDGKMAGYQVTYQIPSGEWRAKVLLTKGYEGKEFFEFLMKPTLVKHGAGMWIDAIRVKGGRDFEETVPFEDVDKEDDKVYTGRSKTKSSS